MAVFNKGIEVIVCRRYVSKWILLFDIMSVNITHYIGITVAVRVSAMSTLFWFNSTDKTIETKTNLQTKICKQF